MSSNMKIEARRFLNGKYAFLILGLVSLCNILGYVLLITIDHVQVQSIYLLFESTYTVFTQFGMLIYSPLVISLFANDYKEKNILFYKSAGCSAVQYFANRVLVLIIGFLGAITLVTVVVAAIFRDFSILHIMLSYYWLVTICFIFEISLWAFLFKSFIFSFFVNFTLWIVLTVISSIGGVFQYAAYYDASSPLYENLVQFLRSQPCESVMSLCLQSGFYDICVIVVVFVMVIIFKRRWNRNGI